MSGDGEPDSFEVTLAAAPPTVTHQAKVIGYAFAKGGRRVAKLRDSDALAAARDAYHKLLLASGRRPRRPMPGPLRLTVVLCFPGDAVAWHTKPPDWDNCVKVLQDALVDAGFVARDQEVSEAAVVKIRGPVPYVRVLGYRLDPAAAELLYHPPAAGLTRKDG